MGFGHGHGYGVGKGSSFLSGSWTPAAMGTDIAIWTIPETLGAVGTDITQWNDESGNANHLVQSVAEPVVVAGVIDGYKGAEVLKTGRYFVQTNFLTFNGDFEFFYLYSKTDDSTSWLPISTLGSGSHYIRDNVNEAYQLVASGASRYLTTADYTPKGVTVVLGSLRRESGTCMASFNGVDFAGTPTEDVGNYTLATNVMNSGGGILVEPIIVPRICTVTERANINAYYKAKYPSAGIA